MTELRRRISLFGGAALAVGMVVGSGVFGLPGLALQLSSPRIAAFGWLACAIACFPLLCVFAILGTRYACAAGIARYAEAALGRRAEFAVTAVLCGTFPLTVPAQSMIGASYARIACGLDQGNLVPVSALILFVAVAFNLCGSTRLRLSIRLRSQSSSPPQGAGYELRFSKQPVFDRPTPRAAGNPTQRD